MKYLTIYGDTINQKAIDEAVKTLKDGGLAVYPTDTIYALGCNALDNAAITRLCKAKGINPDKQLLSIVCSDLSQASEYAKIDNRAFRLMKRHMPGAFTFILPAASSLPKVFKGRKTVGVRIPDSAISRALAEALGNPVLSSSVSVDVPEEATDPMSLEFRYENIADCIIDGGLGGLEPSTIVDCVDSQNPEVVRQGAGIFEP